MNHRERIQRADEAARIIGMVPNLEHRLECLEGRVERLECEGDPPPRRDRPTTSEVEALVRTCIEVATGVHDYDPHDSFVHDLGLDSLDAVELVMAIEEETGTDVSEALAEQWLTPAHVVSYVAGVLQS